MLIWHLAHCRRARAAARDKLLGLAVARYGGGRLPRVGRGPARVGRVGRAPRPVLDGEASWQQSSGQQQPSDFTVCV
eukprot:7386707-Prymnesium_polylepis.3